MELIVVLENDSIEIMKKRIDRAVEKYKSSPDTYFNFIKGENCVCKNLIINQYIPDDSYDSNILKKYVSEKDINSENIIMRNGSENLEETFSELKKIIKERYTLFTPNITLCTSTFNVSRVLLVSKFYLSEYGVSIIHTKEEVNEEEQKKERQLMYQFINDSIK